MKKTRAWLLLIVVIFALVGCSSTTGKTEKNTAERNKQWIEDIDYLTSKLREMHPNLFFNTTSEDYYKRIESIKSEIPNLSDNEIHFKMKELISIIGDAHTTYYPNTTDKEYNNQKIYPIGYRWFEDELRIVGSSDKYREILGMKLTEINDIPIKDIVEKISTITFYENKEWLKNESLDILISDNDLVYLGISDGDKVKYNLEDDNGKKLERTVNTIKRSDMNQTQFVAYKDTIDNRHIPLEEEVLGNEFRPYWYKVINEDNIFYFKYNICKDKQHIDSFPKFEEFSADLIKSFESNIDNIDKLVIDVRNNPGGLSSFMTDLSKELKEVIGEKDIKVYVITNRGTFSSAIFALADLKNNLDATIVGTETGGNVVFYGNLHYIESPSGKSEIAYSSNKYDFKEYAGLNGEGGVIPDIYIKESFKSFKSGIDDCYEYIKTQK